MRIIDIRIDGFGKLVDRFFSFDEGINVIYGLNEQGKSTLHACIRAMFFGMVRARGRAALTDEWSHYKPWNTLSYGAVMRVEHEGHTYRLTRDFARDTIGVEIYDETLEAEVKDQDAMLSELLAGLSRVSFDNSISIGQLATASDGEMAEELKKYILNLNTTGNKALNSENAKDLLQKRRKDLESKIEPEAARDYASNLTEIQNIEKTLSAPEYENTLPVLKKKRAENTATFGVSPWSTANEIEQARSRIKDALYAYSAQRLSSTGKVAGTFGVLAFLVFLCGAACGAYCLLLQRGMIPAYIPVVIPDLLQTAYIAGGAALLAFIIWLFCWKKKKSYERDLAEKTNTLEASVASFLPGQKAGDFDMKKADDKLNGFKEGLRLDDEIKEKTERMGELELYTERLQSVNAENRRLQKAIAENGSLNEELDSVNYALEVIDELSEDMKTSFALFLNKDSSNYIRRITDGVYDSLNIDEDMNIFMNAEDRMVPLDSLSVGARDQVYLAFRLAAARFLQGERDVLPLIMDDSFVNYDEDRLTNVLKWLPEVYKGQILLFTCHKREAQLLEKAGIPFKLNEL